MTITALLLLALCSIDPEVYLDFTSLTRDMIPTFLITEFDHPENPVDILHYDISLEVFLDLHEIVGTTEIEMTASTEAITDIRLDLRQLTADSVWDATGGYLTFSRMTRYL